MVYVYIATINLQSDPEDFGLPDCNTFLLFFHLEWSEDTPSDGFDKII
jgi:hypothetical protein